MSIVGILAPAATVSIIGHFHPGPDAVRCRRSCRKSAAFELETMRIIGGRLSPRIQRLIGDWGARHRTELEANWRRVVAHQAPLWIEPDE